MGVTNVHLKLGLLALFAIAGGLAALSEGRWLLWFGAGLLAFGSLLLAALGLWQSWIKIGQDR